MVYSVEIGTWDAVHVNAENILIIEVIMIWHMYACSEWEYGKGCSCSHQTFNLLAESKCSDLLENVRIETMFKYIFTQVLMAALIYLLLILKI